MLTLILLLRTNTLCDLSDLVDTACNRMDDSMSAPPHWNTHQIIGASMTYSVTQIHSRCSSRTCPSSRATSHIKYKRAGVVETPKSFSTARGYDLSGAPVPTFAHTHTCIPPYLHIVCIYTPIHNMHIYIHTSTMIGPSASLFNRRDALRCPRWGLWTLDGSRRCRSFSRAKLWIRRLATTIPDARADRITQNANTWGVMHTMFSCDRRRRDAYIGMYFG